LADNIYYFEPVSATGRAHASDIRLLVDDLCQLEPGNALTGYSKFLLREIDLRLATQKDSPFLFLVTLVWRLSSAASLTSS
jgi:hypothetical protein